MNLYNLEGSLLIFFLPKDGEVAHEVAQEVAQIGG